MEASSAKGIARSQAAAAASSRNSMNGAGDRPALLDITNDSPVVGLIPTGEKTPSSAATKKSALDGRRTPLSGEDVLRGQVRTLLQKVEEEAELVSLGHHHYPPPLTPSLFPTLLGLLRSPTHLLAPTPANTPQFPFELVPLEIATPCVPSQAVVECFGAAENLQAAENLLGLEECQINRALTFESPEKSDISTICSSLTYECSGSSEEKSSCLEDDNSSIWSIQANASPNSENEEVDEDEEHEEDDLYYEEAEDDEADEDDLLELCEGVKKMSVVAGLPEFAGKHARFVYNSEDEMEREEVVKESVSPSVLVLKGLPVPEGKHLRFHEEDEE